MKRLMLSGLLMAAALTPALRAQGETEGGPGVARLSLLNGDVSVRRGDSGDWVAAAINAPVLANDRVFSGPNSRAEVQFDFHHRARLASETELRLTELDNKKYLMQLARGTMTFAAIKGGDAQVEISTPGAAVRPVDHGDYRITVRPDGTAEITVRSGEAEIFTPTGSQTLKPGRTLLVRTSEGGAAESQTIQALAMDSWDEFNRNRDKDLQSRAKVYKYVSRDVYGAEDLDGQGDWVYAEPYGYVWRPYVAAGWAPYRAGRWAWADYYGWNWISYDPWGWAPYHYGRWFYWGNNWCWYPGAIGAHHYWSPGIVTWFGWGGGGFSAGIGFGWGGWGRVGWCPLAPFEPYYPWYGRHHYGGYRNPGGFNNYGTIVNNYNVVNNYRNARIHGGVTVNEVNDFSRGATGRAWRASDGTLERASLVKGGMVPVTPQRESLRLAERDAASHAIPRGSDAGATRFYSRTEASRADRVPFEQQRQAMEQFARRSAPEAASGRAVQENVNPGSGRGASDSRSAGTRGSEWQSFGEPRSGSTTSRSGEAATGRSADTERGGWRTFGDPSTARTESRNSGMADRGSSSTGRTSRSEDTGRTSGTADRGGWSTGRASGAADTGRSSGTADRGSWSTGRTSRTEDTGRTSGSADRGGSSTGRGASSTGGSTGGSRQADTPRTAAPGGRSSESGTGRGSSRQDMSFNGGSWSTGTRSAGSGISEGYSSRSAAPGGGGYYGGSRSSGSAPSYSAPSYSGGSRGMGSAPSYGGGGYYGGSRSSGSAPSYSAPSYSGGSRSMGSAPSFGGGGGFSGGSRGSSGGGGAASSGARGGGGGGGGGGGSRGGGGGGRGH